MIDEKKVDKYFYLLRSYALQLDANGMKNSAKQIYEVADYLESLKEQPQAGKWIPCEERLPSEDGYYLVTTNGMHNAIIDIAFFYLESWHKASKVIAWMPLPAPYKKGCEE